MKSKNLTSSSLYQNLATKKFLISQHIPIISELCNAIHDPNLPWKYQVARCKHLGGDRSPPYAQTDHRNSTPLSRIMHVANCWFFIPKPRSLRSLSLDKFELIKYPENPPYVEGRRLFSKKIEYQYQEVFSTLQSCARSSTYSLRGRRPGRREREWRLSSYCR